MKNRVVDTAGAGTAILEFVAMATVLFGLILGALGTADFIAQSSRVREVVELAVGADNGAPYRLTEISPGRYTQVVDSATVSASLDRLAADLTDRLTYGFAGLMGREMWFEIRAWSVPVDPHSGQADVTGATAWVRHGGSLSVGGEALAKTDLEEALRRFSGPPGGGPSRLAAPAPTGAGGSAGTFRPATFVLGVRAYRATDEGVLQYIGPVIGLPPYVGAMKMGVVRRDAAW